jgi:hypothetical protein
MMGLEPTTFYMAMCAKGWWGVSFDVEKAVAVPVASTWRRTSSITVVFPRPNGPNSPNVNGA